MPNPSSQLATHEHVRTAEGRVPLRGVNSEARMP